MPAQEVSVTTTPALKQSSIFDNTLIKKHKKPTILQYLKAPPNNLSTLYEQALGGGEKLTLRNRKKPASGRGSHLL